MTRFEVLLICIVEYHNQISRFGTLQSCAQRFRSYAPSPVPRDSHRVQEDCIVEVAVMKEARRVMAVVDEALDDLRQALTCEQRAICFSNVNVLYLRMQSAIARHRGGPGRL